MEDTLSAITWRPKFDLTPAQRRMDESPARFIYCKAGRRFGKTKWLVRRQIKQIIKSQPVDHWYITPTQKMAHEIVWDEYLEQLGRDLITKVDERGATVWIANGAKLYLKGSDKIEKTLRGRKLGSAAFDEAAYHRPHIFPEIVRPMLADLEAPAWFMSSPKKSWFTRDWNLAKAGEIEDAEAFHFTIYDNPLISRAEIGKIRAATSEDVWQQEYMANELDMCGKVYMEFSSDSIFAPAEKFPGHTSHPCVMGADWGLMDPTAVAWLHFLPNGTVVMSAEHVKANWDVSRHVEVIKQISKGRNIDHGCSVLDASAFRREGSSGGSVAEAFRKEGVVFLKADRDVDASTELLKRFLRGAGNGPWLYISGRCREAIRAFNEWEHGEHEPDILAAVRYALFHGVRKRMSRLMDGGAIPEMDEPRSMAGCLKRSSGARWSFDEDNGVPI